MKKLLITLLMVTGLYAQSAVVSVTKRDGSKIDSLVKYMGKFVENPTSWCVVTPVGFELMYIRAKYGYVSVDVNIQCDASKYQEDLIKVVTRAIGRFNRKTGEWDGIIGQSASMGSFLSAFNRQYPWVRATWSTSTRAFVLHSSDNYGGGGGQTNLYFKVKINGIELVDVVNSSMAGLSYPNIVSLTSPLALGVVYVAPEDTVGLYPRRFADNRYTIQFGIKSDIANKLANMESVSIDIERIKYVDVRRSPTGYFFAGQSPYIIRE